MIKMAIFAKYGTTERVLVPIMAEDGRGVWQQEQGKRVQETQQMLARDLGGDWVLVQDLKAGEAVSFTASKLYLGYDGGDDYCQQGLVYLERLTRQPIADIPTVAPTAWAGFLAAHPGSDELPTKERATALGKYANSHGFRWQLHGRGPGQWQVEITRPDGSGMQSEVYKCGSVEATHRAINVCFQMMERKEGGYGNA